MSPEPKTRTLRALNKLRENLGLRDIGISVRRRELYLLGGARTLTSLFGHPLYRSWHHKTGTSFEQTWDRLEYVLLDILREVKVPQPGPVGEYGLWSEGATKRGKYVNAWRVIPIPAPGGPQGAWWSSRAGRRMKAVKVRARRFCDDEKHPLFLAAGAGDRPALLELEGGRAGVPPIFISHGVGLHDFAEIRKCGGLLWPSFAVTWKVPPSYGDIVFLADVHMLVDSLGPTGRKKPNLHLSPTDSWSPTPRELEGVERAITYELRGDRDWWVGNRGVPGYGGELGGRGNRFIQNHLLSGNRPTEDLVGGHAPDSAGDEIRTMNALWRRVKRLVRVHGASGTYGYEDPDELIERLGYEGQADADRYAYLELKVRGMVPLGGLVACFYPRKAARRVHRFLDAMGFDGWRIPFRYPGRPAFTGNESATDEERAEWASAATQAILGWASDPCAHKAPEDVLSDSRWALERHPYQPMAPYSRKENHALDSSYKLRFRWSRGFCPRSGR